MGKILDANAILRYMLDDITEQAEITENAINEGASTIPEVIPELVYVLEGVYRLDRIIIKETLTAFLDEINVENKPIIKNALDIYAKRKMDFVDCLLASHHQLLDAEILTFDKQLLKIL